MTPGKVMTLSVVIPAAEDGGFRAATPPIAECATRRDASGAERDEHPALVMDVIGRGRLRGARDGVLKCWFGFGETWLKAE